MCDFLFEDRIMKLLSEDEDEYHDFKLEWYTKHQKDEMIKDQKELFYYPLCLAIVLFFMANFSLPFRRKA